MIEVGDFFLTFFLKDFGMFWYIEHPFGVLKPFKFYVVTTKNQIPHLGIEVGDFGSVVQSLHPLF